jgi:hypothetical protein
MHRPFRHFPALLLLGSSMLLARDYGPAIGSRMPDFDAPGQDGNNHSLHSLLGPKGAIILFFRSADW